jgi:hypothetical protein
MADRMGEFIVDGWVTGESGRFTVIGCCGDVPIRINDRFDAIIRYKRRKYPEEMGDDPVVEFEMPASIRVEQIQAYGRSLDMLGQGMTGSMVVSGEGIERISNGMVLGSRNGANHGSGVAQGS